MTSKKQAQAAKKTVQERLGETDASVGLTVDADGSYVVAIRFAKKPTKKLIASLTKGLDVKVETTVVEAVAALPAMKKSPKKTSD